MKCLLFLLLPLLFWATPIQAAVNWQSYSDPARTVQSDDFTAPNSIVYMKGTGLAKSKTYRSTFWDACGDNPYTYDGQSDNKGVYISQVKPGDYPTSSPGLWTAKLEKITGGAQLVAADTFTVQASAIPEIPSVIAGLSITGFCALIWRKLRRVI